MPTLKTFSGPVRQPGSCGCGPGDQSTQPSLLPGGDGPCGPGPGEEQLPGNTPVSDAQYQCSPGVLIQAAIDVGRRVTHELGFRPYRVFMVWQERGRDRRWQCVQEMELIPVRLIALDAVDLELSQHGLNPEGGISLREVSPAQVSEDDLRGYLNGQPWGADTIEREFFFEVRLHDRCRPQDVPGLMRYAEGGPRRRRFTLGAEPHLDANGYQWRIGLVDQDIARTRGGEDQSTDPDQQRMLPTPRIVP